MPSPPSIDIDDPDAVDRVAAALRAGGVVVLPTDTVYGLAALPGQEALLAAMKDRPAAMAIAVLIASADSIDLPPIAARLAARFWPGPLTIVVPDADGGTVGVRCPDHAFVRAVAATVGPLPTTSANQHGRPTAPTAMAAAMSLTGAPALVVDGGRCEGAPSTVVDCTGDTVAVLREGALPGPAILAALS